MSFKLTPIMKQYLDLKAENPDSILLFRLGDFYEIFFEDAKFVSKLLGIVLTHRGKDVNGNLIPMCGIPWHALNNYIEKLVKSGSNIALVEQTETPEEAKLRGHKYIERKIVRILTSGTITDDNLLNPSKSNFLISISEKSNNSFFLAGCDISTGEFFIGDTKSLLDDLFRLNPAEIIYKEEFAEYEDIKNIRKFFKTTPINNRIYKRVDIENIVHKFFNNDAPLNNDSVNMLAGYLFNTQRDTNIIFKPPYLFKKNKQLLIDSSTWKSLEIDSVINEGSVCLFDILNETKTSFGTRKLRSYIRSLSSDIDEIISRQTHINFLINNDDLLKKIISILEKIPDAERSLQRLLSGRGIPRDLKNILNFLTILPEFQNLTNLLDKNLSDRSKEINLNKDLFQELSLALNDELPAFFRDGDIIKSGFNSDLDNIRQLSFKAKEMIANMQAEYISKTEVNNLKIKYNNILGYFIEAPAVKSDMFLKHDDLFIHRQTLSNVVRFTTSELINLDNDIRNSYDKSIAIELSIIENFISKIKNISKSIIDSIDFIADVDVFCSLSICAIKYSWVCPVITENNDFEILGGRHPVIEYVLKKSNNNFIKNDCCLDKKSIALLTGPNMAGKSTYLRQNALIVILSHLGSFVPADKAKIGLCDQLFSRVGASDNLAAGYSTFMIEMVETANILNRATNKSFIILDEIGRGTATYDGMAIAQSVLEYLDKLKIRSLFATHYHELTKLVENNQLDNSHCLTIDVKEYNNDIIFMHKIISGVANRSYGIFVAKMAGVPDIVLNRAEEILKDLENSIKNTDNKKTEEQLSLF